jgi:hypothetical protein
VQLCVQSKSCRFESVLFAFLRRLSGMNIYTKPALCVEVSLSRATLDFIDSGVIDSGVRDL